MKYIYLALATALILGAYYFNAKDNTPQVAAQAADELVKKTRLESKPGVSRLQKPTLNISSKLKLSVAAPALDKKLQDEVADIMKNGYGAIQPVDLSDMTPQKASVVEAIQTGEHRERLSIMAKREPFDEARYKSDSYYYTNVVIPGRVYDLAVPGEGVPRLTRISDKYIETTQNEPVELSLQGAANSPITLTALHGGFFENGLSSISIDSGKSGQVSVQFTAGQGVIMDCKVLAGSPMSSNQLKFNINVKKSIIKQEGSNNE